jgi:hypothetical protein
MAISSSALRNLLTTFPDNARVLGFAEGLIVMTPDASGKVVVLNEPLCVLDQNQPSASVGSAARKGIRLVGNTDDWQNG